MLAKPVRIIQLSDLHLFDDPEGSLLGVKTEESFMAVLEQLKKEEFSFIVLTGDLTQEGSDVAYARIAKALKSFQRPVYFVAGNHDDVKAMARVYPAENISNHRHIILKDWQLILLHSPQPGAVEGYLDRSQLHYLKHCLQTYPEHQAIVFFHHHPLLMGSSWLDDYRLMNADAFWQIAAYYPQIAAVFYGHVHMATEERVNKTMCYSAPSTCVQFKRHAVNFTLDNLPQGYRVIELYADGCLKTEVKRLAHYIGHFTAKAEGY
jgi:Icc protein